MTADLSALRIVLADDTPLICDLLSGVLQSVGVKEIRIARSGQAALDTLSKWAADILFLDWEMGSMSGLEVVKTIRESYCNVDPCLPIIMTTAHSEESKVIAARSAGVHEYLMKPFTGKAVLARLAAVVNDDRPFIRTETYFGPAPRPTRVRTGPSLRSQKSHD